MAKFELTDEQKAVVANRGGTLLVSAAAGSGKTKVLVDRVMSRIRDGQKNVSDFLIITFTKAAAAELKEKIENALAEEITVNPTNAHLIRQRSLLRIAQISTVHSFCANLIREYGYLIDVPSDFSMIEEAEGDELLAETVIDVLEEAYREMTEPFHILCDTLGAGRTDSDLDKYVLKLISKAQAQIYPEKWLLEQKNSIPEGECLAESKWGKLYLAWAEEQINLLLQRHAWAIDICEHDPKLSKKYYPAYVKQSEQLLKLKSALHGQWDDIQQAMEIEFDRVSVNGYEDEQLKNAIKEVREATKSLVNDKLKPVFSTLESSLIADQNRMAVAIDCLLGLTAEVLKRFESQKRSRNVLDYNNLEHYAIALLLNEDGSLTDVARDVQQKFVEIMVDEYQDSNEVQECIYKAIAKEGDVNRFLVGDMKQSIYAFREANPQMFAAKYRDYVYAEEESVADNQPRKLILSKNFRSRPEILEAANHIFEMVMSERVGDLNYGEKERLYQGREDVVKDENPRVFLNVLFTEASDEDSGVIPKKEQLEAEWTAEKICSLLKNGLPVSDGETIRNAKPEDFAILLRNNEPAKLYRKALEKRGIPVYSENGGNLFDAPEIRVIMNFLRVINNPHQDIPLLSVLCCPVFHLSNDQLAEIRLVGKDCALYDAMKQLDCPWASAVIKELERLKQLSRQDSALRVVWSILYETGLIDSYSADQQAISRAKNLQAFYELCSSVASGRYLYLYDLIRNLQRMAKKDTIIASAKTTGVTIASIHKSKGLEYPVVFLSGLSKGFNFMELNESVLIDGSLGVSAKIVDSQKRIRYPGIAFHAMSHYRRQQMLSEEMRILYVAMTRPKEYLFMNYTTGKALSALGKMAPALNFPVGQWAASSAKCLGDWVLLAALGRIEAGELHAIVGKPNCPLKVCDTPWSICVESVSDALPISRYGSEAEKLDEMQQMLFQKIAPSGILEAAIWDDPNRVAEVTPSKLTATELKGRYKDKEVSERAKTSAVHKLQLERPEFILQERELTSTEKGIAAHKFIQYAQYNLLTTLKGIEDERVRMVDEEFLTEQEADSIDKQAILKLFTSDLGKKLVQGNSVIREYKFSILADAGEYYPELAERKEQVLLQGVIDAAIVEDDGITIVDFKTDRVSPNTIALRTENYRPQVNLYRKAMEEITRLPIKACMLYYLATGDAVSL